MGKWIVNVRSKIVFFLFHPGDAISDLVSVRRDIETRRLDVVCLS